MVDIAPSPLPRFPSECQQLPGPVEWVQHHAAHKSVPLGGSEPKYWTLWIRGILNPNVTAQARDFHTLAVSEAA